MNAGGGDGAEGLPRHVRLRGDPQNWFPPAPRAPRAPVPRPARGGQRHRARSPGASAAAAPRGLRGQPGQRRLLSSRSLRRRLPWPGSVPGTRLGGGGRGGGGRARSARGPGLRAAEGASRGQHQAAKRASPRWPGGVPAQPAGKPRFPTAALPAPPPLLPEKVGKSPTRTRTASSRLRSRWPTTTQRDVGGHLAGIFLASVSPMTPGRQGANGQGRGVTLRLSWAASARASQSLLPLAPAPLPRSQRWAGGPGMTVAEPRPDSPSPPPRARASPGQSPRGNRLSRGAPSSRRPETSTWASPAPAHVRAPGLEPGRREGAREQPAATRKRHIRSRKDPPPEQPLFGQRLIWNGPIWPGRFRLGEEGRRRREELAGAMPGTPEQPGPGSPQRRPEP